MLEEIIPTPGFSQERQKILKTFCEKIVSTFGNYGNQNSHYDFVINQILTSFSRCPLINRQIHTLDDLYSYAHRIMQVAKSAMDPTKVGSCSVDSIPQNNARVIEQLIGLMQEDVTQDLASLAQLIPGNKQPHTNKAILNSLFMIKGLIRNSRDLQRFAQFVERLFESGLDVEHVLMGHMGTFHHTPPLFGSYMNNKKLETWENYTEKYGLDGALSLMEAIVVHGINPEAFVNGVGLNLLQTLSPEQLKHLQTYLSEICAQAKNIYGSSANQVMEKFFYCLHSHVLRQHIQTPENFRHYANQIIRLSKCLHDPFYHLKDTFAYLTELIRENFDQDLEILIQLMEEQQQLDKKRCLRDSGTIINSLHFIKGLIRSSQDVERMRRFVQCLLHAGFNAKNILCNGRSVYDGRSLFKDGGGQFLKEYITDSERLDAVLSVFEMVIDYYSDERDFASILNFVHKMTDPQCTRFISDAIPFSKKGIPPQFVVEHIYLVNEPDFTQNGLAIFSNFDGKAKWLEYCGHQLTKNPQFILTAVPFFNEALSLSATDIIHETAFSILKTAIIQLCKTNGFSALQEITQAIQNSSGILSEIDGNDSLALEIAKNPCFDVLLSNFFKNPLFKILLPKTFASATMKVYARILSTDALTSPNSDFNQFYTCVGIFPTNEMLQEKYLDLLTKYTETLYD